MKKLIVLLLAVAMVFTLAACGNQQTPVEEPEKTATESAYKGTYDVLKMATNAAFPPYEYKEGEDFAGIDVEIATAIAKELGAELEIVDMEFDSIIASVQSGETSFGMAGMTVTDERKEEVDFSF